MSFVRKTLALLLHGIAGMVLLTALIFTFIDLPAEVPRAWSVAVPTLIALVLFGVATAVGDFRQRWLPTGAALLVVCGMEALSMLSFACMAQSPEFMQLITPGQTLQIFLPGLAVGVMLVTALAWLGWALVRRG